MDVTPPSEDSFQLFDKLHILCSALQSPCRFAATKYTTWPMTLSELHLDEFYEVVAEQMFETLAEQ